MTMHAQRPLYEPLCIRIAGINLDAGLYYVVVDGYGSNDGHTLDINLSAQQIIRNQ